MATTLERLTAVEVHLENQGEKITSMAKKVDDLHVYFLESKGEVRERGRMKTAGHTLLLGFAAVIGAVAGAITAIAAYTSRFGSVSPISQ